MAEEKLKMVIEELKCKEFDVDSYVANASLQSMFAKEGVQKINTEINEDSNKKMVACDQLKTKADDVNVGAQQAAIQYNQLETNFAKLNLEKWLLIDKPADAVSSDSLENSSQGVVEKSLLDNLLPEFVRTYQIEWIMYYLKSIGLLCHNECNLIKKKIEIDDQFKTMFTYLTFKPFEDVIKNLQQICIDMDWPKILHSIVTNLEIFGRRDLIISTNTGFSIYENIQPFSTAILKLDKWKNLIWLGSGAFGEVRLCILPQKISKIACKRVWLKEFNNERQINALTRELAIHRSLNNEHIVNLHGFRFEEPFAYFFMEYMPGGSLKEEISRKGGLTEEETLHYVKQILLGLTYLHENGILHRDLKNRNILKVNESKVKLSDFGESKRILLNNLGESLHTNTADVGTDHFMAPEVITGESYGRKADMWSLGCVIVEMLTGKPPWGEYNGYTVKYLIGSGKTPMYTLQPNVSNRLHRLLDDLFDFVPEKRPDTMEALELPLFRKAIVSFAQKPWEYVEPSCKVKPEIGSLSTCKGVPNLSCSSCISIQLLPANIKGKYLKRYYEHVFVLKYGSFGVKFDSDGSVQVQGTQSQLADCSKYINILLANVVCSENVIKHSGVLHLNSKCIAVMVKIMDETQTLITIDDESICDTFSQSTTKSPFEYYLEGVINKNVKILVYKADIGMENVNAIVISANNALNLSGDACKRIVDEGGEQIQAECKKYISRNGRLNISDVFISSAGSLNCEKIIHVVCPSLKDVTPDETSSLKKGIANVFRSAESLQLSSIAISALSIDEPCYNVEKAISVIVETAILSTKKFESLKEIHFVDNDQQAIETFIKEFSKNKNFTRTENETFTRSSGTTIKSSSNTINKKPTTPPIFLEEDNILNVAKRCDVIVNSVPKGPHFIFCGGAICKAISYAAGPAMIREAEKRYPYGIGDFAIGVTGTGNLGCKKVFHVHCPHQWDPEHSVEEIKGNIVACLNKMENKKLSSIAFPALGTGPALRYPPDIVANVMYDTVQSWWKKHSTLYLKKIIFVVLPSQEHVVSAFVQQAYARNTTGNIVHHSAQGLSFLHGKAFSATSATEVELKQPYNITENIPFILIRLLQERKTKFCIHDNATYCFEERSVCKILQQAPSGNIEDNTGNLNLSTTVAVHQNIKIAKLQVCGPENAVQEAMSMLNDLLEKNCSCGDKY